MHHISKIDEFEPTPDEQAHWADDGGPTLPDDEEDDEEPETIPEEAN